MAHDFGDVCHFLVVHQQWTMDGSGYLAQFCWQTKGENTFWRHEAKFPIQRHKGKRIASPRSLPDSHLCFSLPQPTLLSYYSESSVCLMLLLQSQTFLLLYFLGCFYTCLATAILRLFLFCLL